MKPPLFSCLTTRVADNGSLYGRFLFGPLPIDLSLTVATVLRRSLLHNQATFTIVEAEIEGATHEYASLPGIQESVLEILLNLGEIVLTSAQGNFLSSNFRTSIESTPFAFASLRISGPGIVTAKDINWPKGVFCVKPDAYIATLSSNETFALRIKIACFFKKSQTSNSEKREAQVSSVISNSSVSSNQIKKNSFEFFRLSRITKQGSAFVSTTLSNSSPQNLAIAGSLTHSNAIEIQDYSPLSSYSLRKRNLADNTDPTQFEKKTNLSDFQNSSLSETTLDFFLESKKIEKEGEISSPETPQDQEKASVTFHVFPRLNNIDSKQVFINGSEKAELKNKDKTVAKPLTTTLLAFPNKTGQQNRIESSSFDKGNTFKIENLPIKESVPLSVSSSSYPVEKVNFLIERDDELAGYRHRIILEVWTNGSISPRQAIFDSIGSIMRLIYSFREPVRNILN